MKPKWHAGLVAVCEKCGKKMTSSSDVANPSHLLKDWLKKELRDRELWGRSRVILSSCLDICPEGKVAVAFLSDQPGMDASIEVIDPHRERDRILEIAIDRLER